MNRRWLLIAILAGCGGTGLSQNVRKDITTQMTSAQPPIQACYADALKSNHKLRGTMVLQFAAEPSTGQFSEVAVGRDELADPKLTSCVVTEVGKLKLAAPQSTRVAVSYPIHFEPNR